MLFSEAEIPLHTHCLSEIASFLPSFNRFPSTAPACVLRGKYPNQCRGAFYPYRETRPQMESYSFPGTVWSEETRLTGYGAVEILVFSLLGAVFHYIDSVEEVYFV
jgi:hypothetical protein